MLKTTWKSLDENFALFEKFAAYTTADAEQNYRVGKTLRCLKDRVEELKDASKRLFEHYAERRAWVEDEPEHLRVPPEKRDAYNDEWAKFLKQPVEVWGTPLTLADLKKHYAAKVSGAEIAALLDWYVLDDESASAPKAAAADA